MAIGNGQATFSTSSLFAGTHSITGTYTGRSPNYLPSTSAALTEIINTAVTTTTLTPSLNPSSYNQIVTFTAQVGSAGGTPTGTVTFSDGSTPLGNSPLGGGTATLSAALTVGLHSINAVYSGDANFNSSSASLNQMVESGEYDADAHFQHQRIAVWSAADLHGHDRTAVWWASHWHSYFPRWLHDAEQRCRQRQHSQPDNEQPRL